MRDVASNAGLTCDSVSLMAPPVRRRCSRLASTVEKLAFAECANKLMKEMSKNAFGDRLTTACFALSAIRHRCADQFMVISRLSKQIIDFLQMCQTHEMPQIMAAVRMQLLDRFALLRTMKIGSALNEC